MPDTGKYLSFEDAQKLVYILIGIFPECRYEWRVGAFEDSIREWPDTDWLAIENWLRSDEMDASKVADWLAEAIKGR